LNDTIKQKTRVIFHLLVIAKGGESETPSGRNLPVIISELGRAVLRGLEVVSSVLWEEPLLP
jgi:hypothetical protein